MIKSVEFKSFKLLLPRKDVCQICATAHKPEDPHNKESLYYQYSFQAAHGRWPTWLDALDHCAENVKKAWLKELSAKGVQTS